VRRKKKKSIFDFAAKKPMLAARTASLFTRQGFMPFVAKETQESQKRKGKKHEHLKVVALCHNHRHHFTC